MMVFEPSADEIRDRATEIVSREEYRRGLTLWERFLHWLAELLGPRVPEAERTRVGGFEWLSVVLWIVLVIVIVAVIALVIVLVKRGILSRARQEEGETDDTEISTQHRKTQREWAGEASEFEAQEAWKDALRCRYREVVRWLVDQAIVPSIPGRTTGELREDLLSGCAAAWSPFDELSTEFELAWYADGNPRGLPTGAPTHRADP